MMANQASGAEATAVSTGRQRTIQAAMSADPQPLPDRYAVMGHPGGAQPVAVHPCRVRAPDRRAHRLRPHRLPAGWLCRHRAQLHRQRRPGRRPGAGEGLQHHRAVQVPGAANWRAQPARARSWPRPPTCCALTPTAGSPTTPTAPAWCATSAMPACRWPAAGAADRCRRCGRGVLGPLVEARPRTTGGQPHARPRRRSWSQRHAALGRVARRGPGRHRPGRRPRRRLRRVLNSSASSLAGARAGGGGGA
jgi:hypothetical protein